MTRNLLFAIGLLAMTVSLQAETIVPAGDVNGSWTIDGSPYLIQGNIRVPAGETLRIGAGVQVIFVDYYLFTINGRLECAGTATSRVRLTCEFGESETGWQGMRVGSDDTLSFSYTVIENIHRNENALAGIDASFSVIRLDHCLIQNVTGNGLHAANGSLVEATDCEFLSNGYTMDSGLGSACLIRQNSTMIGKRCLFENNFSNIDGGAIHAGIGCLLALDSCEFSNNGCNLWGAAIDVNSAKLRITNCEFNNNHGAKGGAAYLQTPDTTLFDHCIFYGNEASEGAAIYIYPATDNPVTVLHCDFVRNVSTEAGVIRAESHFTAKHSIFHENSGAAVYFLDPSARVEYCSFFPEQDELFSGMVPTGLGELNQLNHNGDSVDTYQNLFVDPAFVDELAGDLRLQVGSPCIDAGDASFPFDPDGTVADIGRYSFTQETAVAPHSLLPTDISVMAFPNPFNSSLALQLELPATAELSLKIFDVAGREVEQLLSGTLATGSHRLMWNAAGVPSGVYFVGVESGGVFVTQKVLLLK